MKVSPLFVLVWTWFLLQSNVLVLKKHNLNVPVHVFIFFRLSWITMVKDNFVQTFVESRLTALHNTSAPSVTNYKQKIISFVVAAVLISMLPILHIGTPNSQKLLFYYNVSGICTCIFYLHVHCIKYHILPIVNIW